MNGSLSYRIGWPAGRPFHDISVLLGARWDRVGIGAGGRFFLTPGKDLIGPEVGLRAWF